jgi:hypothetical protein
MLTQTKNHIIQLELIIVLLVYLGMQAEHINENMEIVFAVNCMGSACKLYLFEELHSYELFAYQLGKIEWKLKSCWLSCVEYEFSFFLALVLDWASHFLVFWIREQDVLEFVDEAVVSVEFLGDCNLLL